MGEGREGAKAEKQTGGYSGKIAFKRSRGKEKTRNSGECEREFGGESFLEGALRGRFISCRGEIVEKSGGYFFSEC